MPGEHDAELDALLDLLGRSGYLIHQYQHDEQHGPVALAAVRDWGGIIDAVILFDHEHAVAYRTPAGQDADVYAPSHVFWSYAASPVWTLRALFTLAPPGHPDAPDVLGPAPAGIGLSAEGRMPVRMRKRE